MTESNKAQESSASSQDPNVTQSIGELGSAAAEAGGQLKDTATSLTQQAREQATAQVATQKDRVVDTLETVALLLHQAGEQAQQQDKGLVANYAEKAATQLGQFTESLADQDVTQIIESTKQFARREPMLFVGGALAAGFLGARFLRSSSQPQTQSETSSHDSGQAQAPSFSDDTGLPDIATADSGLPPYDMASSDDLPASSLGSTDTTVDNAMSAEMVDFTDEYEDAVLESDPLEVESDTTALVDAGDLESPEKL